ncbi:MAG TPA: DUF2142 domain-containing protein, partial [Acidimicrobiales bacterium]
DTQVPQLVHVVWLMALGAALLNALATKSWRHRVALLTLLAAVTALPVAIEVREAAELGVSWQGRYTLPVACGLPILAALLVAKVRTPRSFVTTFPNIVAASLVVAHVVAYYQLLRRYSVGANGRLWFFTSARWDPPVPSLLLLILYAASITALAWAALAPERRYTETDA